METKHQPHKLIVIGMTGNIGSGKSEVARIFEQLGAKIFSADTLAKTIMVEDKTVRADIASTFGKESYLPDGTLNRSYLAKKVFQDAKQLDALNSIVHPVVIDTIQEEIIKQEKSGKIQVLVVEAALIFEANIQEMFDYIVVVTTEENECMKRVMKRDGLSRDEIVKRMKSQMDAKKKATQADFVIQNNGSLNDLKKNVSFVFQLLSQMS